MAIIAAGRNIAPRAVLGNLVALAIGLVVAGLLAEIGLCLLGLGHPYYSAPELYQPSANPALVFQPRANFVGFSEGTWVQTNSRGLRERELPLEKPPDITRVLFLGDSVTFGPGVRNEEPFPRLLDTALDDRVETVNAGVVGYNTTQELAFFQEVGLAYDPEVVVLTFVVNDLLDAFSIFDHQYQPMGLFADQKMWLRRNSHLYRFVQNLYWRLSLELLRRQTGPTEAARPRERLEKRLAEIAAIAETAQANGAAFLLVLYPDNLEDAVSESATGQRITVRRELTGFAQRSGYPFVDLSDALGDVRDPRSRQFRLREDPHPSAAGHRAIADALRPPLQSIIASLPKPPLTQSG